MSENKLRKKISIECADKERNRIGNDICNQLKGNPDFIDSNIVVNFTSYPDLVSIFVFEEAKPVDIKITL